MVANKSVIWFVRARRGPAPDDYIHSTSLNCRDCCSRPHSKGHLFFMTAALRSTFVSCPRSCGNNSPCLWVRVAYVQSSSSRKALLNVTAPPPPFPFPIHHRRFPKFPSVALPVPSSASGAQPASGASFTPSSVAASSAASTFGISAPTGTFGSGTPGDQVKFGLGPVTTAPGGTPASFDAAIPRFGRPVVSTAAAPTPSAAGAGAPASAAGVTATQAAAGGSGGEQQSGVDGTDVAAAAAGVPGPGALMLDVETRRAARWGCGGGGGGVGFVLCFSVLVRSSPVVFVVRGWVGGFFAVARRSNYLSWCLGYICTLSRRPGKWHFGSIPHAHRKFPFSMALPGLLA